MQKITYPNSLEKVVAFDILGDLLLVVTEKDEKLFQLNQAKKEISLKAIPNETVSYKKTSNVKFISKDKYITYSVSEKLIKKRINGKKELGIKCEYISDFTIIPKENIVVVSYDEEVYFDSGTSLEAFDLLTGESIFKYKDEDIFDLTSIDHEDTQLYLCGFGDEKLTKKESVQFLKTFAINRKGINHMSTNYLPVKDINNIFKIPNKNTVLIVDKTQSGTVIHIYKLGTKSSKKIYELPTKSEVILHNNELIIANNELREFQIYGIIF